MPVFVPVSAPEKEYLFDKYRKKLDFAKTKDMDLRFEQIYTEKLEQYWRFSNCEISDDPDDTHAVESENDEEESNEK